MTEVTEIQNNAWEDYQGLISLLQNQTKTFLYIGQTLKRIREEKLYKQLGNGGFDTFIEFLNNPEIGLAQSTAYLYIDLYSYFIEELGMEIDEVSTMQVVRLRLIFQNRKKFIGNEEEAVDKVREIASLTSFDFAEYAREHRLVKPKDIEHYLDKESDKYVLKIRKSKIKHILDLDTEEVLYSFN